MESSLSALVDGVINGDMRAIARSISLIENNTDQSVELQKKLFPYTGNCHVIGVTGAPGAGKSTLVDKLALHWSRAGQKVAIVAVDPSSPFSHGAVLGDRIRMSDCLENTDVFVRSMATRGALGGIAHSTAQAVSVLDAAGYGIVLVETVGVGQAEVDIVRLADTCIVVVVPGLGDEIQAIKAGILEIADFFVINKSDRPGSDSLYKDLSSVLSMAENLPGEWETAILKAVATEGRGIQEIVDTAEKHKQWLRESKAGQKRKISMYKELIRSSLYNLLEEKAFGSDEELLEKLGAKCLAKEIDPHTAASDIYKKLISDESS
ncbi:MAG: methylmalonyl Co-A mutase-associated GTPase MeaB [Candidatus Dadabacteria bacterium]|nr:MAG: methylmalonyl Co-A mutase-associated GTPase MeaB [Candidatus Dadabacteria bacterium]